MPADPHDESDVEEVDLEDLGEKADGIFNQQIKDKSREGYQRSQIGLLLFCYEQPGMHVVLNETFKELLDSHAPGDREECIQTVLKTRSHAPLKWQLFTSRHFVQWLSLIHI